MTSNNTLIQPDRGQDAIAIHLVSKGNLDEWTGKRTACQRAILNAQHFKGAAGDLAILPDGDGWFAAAGVADPALLTSWCLAKSAEKLPEGVYRLATLPDDQPDGSQSGVQAGNAQFENALLGWQLAQYRFSRYRKGENTTGPRILLTDRLAQIAPAQAEASAVAMVRDLVNTPAQDMGPASLEATATALAHQHKAQIRIVQGDTLAQEYPMVHAVGRAAAREHAPRMIELSWGKADAPHIVLIGKGVCFDSGGLDIKTAAGMALMKKDMGGAAHALALAGLIMESGLAIRLSVFIPAVENAISGHAFRPGDVLSSRKGLQVEIGNTDAEGRLILADALARASELTPDLILDFATLTGAARVALGPDLPALFARRETTSAALLAGGLASDDPCWRLPLHAPYADYLKSDIADLNNSSENSFAGASVAALFLDRFVDEGLDWAHFDTFAWRSAAKPGRPKGGEALGLRAAWRMLRTRYGPQNPV